MTTTENNSSTSSVSNSITLDPKSRKGGRPPYTTDHNKRCKAIASADVLNDVSLRAARAKEEKGTLSNETFKQIMDEVRKERNLPDDFEIKIGTIRQRLLRKKLTVEAHEMNGGNLTPLAPIEPYVAQVVLYMSKIRKSLTPSEIADFVNSVIKDTEHQKKLIEYKQALKIDQDEDDLGRVGYRYVTGFMKRWQHILDSGKGCRFELDRSQWTTYKNFRDMYDDIEETLVACGVAEKLEEP